MRLRSFAACAAVSAAACAPAPVEPPPQPPPNELVIVQAGSLLTLDPHRHSDNPTFSALSHVFETLVALDREMRLEPRLASHWENRSDRVLRLHLREGVRFHDGRPFTSADAVASLNRARAMAGFGIQPFLPAVVDVRPVDEHTLDLETGRRDTRLLNELTWVPMLPADAPMEEITRPVGTGAYRYASGAPGGSLSLERFAGYWGPAPEFPRARIDFVPDEASRSVAVAQGRAHVASYLSAEAWRTRNAERRQRVLAEPGLSVVLLLCPARAGQPFADPRVRRALAVGLDRRRLVADGLGDVAEPEDQLVPAAVFGHAAELPRLPVDRDAARALLAEAGHAGGFDARLQAPDGFADLAEALRAQAAEFGIRLGVELLPWPEFSAMFDRPIEALQIRSLASSGDAYDIADGLLHTPVGSHGSGNTSGYSNPEIDAALDQAEEAPTDTARRALLERALSLARHDAPIVALAVRSRLYAVHPRIDWRPRADGQVHAMDCRWNPGE